MCPCSPTIYSTSNDELEELQSILHKWRNWQFELPSTDRKLSVQWLRQLVDAWVIQLPLPAEEFCFLFTNASRQNVGLTWPPVLKDIVFTTWHFFTSTKHKPSNPKSHTPFVITYPVLSTNSTSESACSPSSRGLSLRAGACPPARWSVGSVGGYPGGGWDMSITGKV